MGTKTDAVNLALSLLGEAGFDSITQDPPAPKLAKVLAQYAAAVGWVLRRHPWLCCMDYRTLGLSSEIAGNWKFPYVYELPLSVVRVWDVETSCEFAVGRLEVGGAQKPVVMTRASLTALNVSFVDGKPPEAWDADLFTLVAYELAARSAGPILESATKAAELHKWVLDNLHLAQGAEQGEHGGERLVPMGALQIARLSAL